MEWKGIHGGRDEGVSTCNYGGRGSESDVDRDDGVSHNTTNRRTLDHDPQESPRVTATTVVSFSEWGRRRTESPAERSVGLPRPLTVGEETGRRKRRVGSVRSVRGLVDET